MGVSYFIGRSFLSLALTFVKYFIKDTKGLDIYDLEK